MNHPIVEHPTSPPGGYNTHLDPYREQETVIRSTTHRKVEMPPKSPLGALGAHPLVWSNHTRFVSGHDGANAAVLRLMFDRHAQQNGQGVSSSIGDLTGQGFDLPIDTSVRVLCVSANAMGAKVAMRTVGPESGLVVIAAQLDGIFHPKVPHFARFTFRQLDKHKCPVVFIPYETRWRSDLKARPSKKYLAAVTDLADVVSQIRNRVAGVSPETSR